MCKRNESNTFLTKNIIKEHNEGMGRFLKCRYLDLADSVDITLIEFDELDKLLEILPKMNLAYVAMFLIHYIRDGINSEDRFEYELSKLLKEESDEVRKQFSIALSGLLERVKGLLNTNITYPYHDVSIRLEDNRDVLSITTYGRGTSSRMLAYNKVSEEIGNLEWVLKGKFISIEGLEGAGKSTTVNNLKEWIINNTNLNVTVVREPGGTPICENIRNIIKSDIPNDKLTDKAELLLIYASRVQLVETVIKPALERGDVVISDRFELSTYAYQGGGRGIAFNTINNISNAVLNGFSPDYYIYLDIDKNTGLERAKQRGDLDRIEKQDIDFFKRVQEGYESFVSENGTIKHIIDANKTPNEVLDAIIGKITNGYVDNIK